MGSELNYNLIFIDCEAYGPCPSMGRLTWFGAVQYPSMRTFSGLIEPCRASKQNPAIPEPIEQLSELQYRDHMLSVFTQFDQWLQEAGGRVVMISDNPAFDWQWINDGFHRTLGRNPLGFSARRIGDFYAGLCGDLRKASEWKRLRITKHDHNPVNDAMGNAEAFMRMLNGERVGKG